MRRGLLALISLTLAACSDSGGGGSNTVPTLAWGGFRQSPANAGVGNGIRLNEGKVKLLFPASAAGMTASTAAIDNSDNAFVGTGSGMVSVDSNGAVRWQASSCELADGTVVPIGPVSSSPTVTAGKVVVFGSDATASSPGAVFALKESGRNIECLFAYTPEGAEAAFSVRSSAQVQIDPLDLGLVSVFIGSGDGYTVALNRTGSLRWRSPAGAAAPAPVTSMPAVGTNGVFYVTTPEGLLSAIDGAGNQLWQFAIGVPPDATLQQSPAVATTVYAFGASSALFGVNPDGRLKWQYLPLAPVLGSPAFASQTIEDGPDQVLDTIVYLSDVNGMLYGVRDLNGQTVELQRCSLDLEQSCRNDSCEPDGGTCDRQTNRCSITLEPCTPDSCGSGNGTCIAIPGMTPVTEETVRVETSPALSGDLFVVVGTTDGRICARNLDGSVPGDEDDAANPWLASGCIAIGTGGPVLSSPSIGRNGRVYATTDEGLYVIE